MIDRASVNIIYTTSETAVRSCHPWYMFMNTSGKKNMDKNKRQGLPYNDEDFCLQEINEVVAYPDVFL